jgi:hypothetical protein
VSRLRFLLAGAATLVAVLTTATACDASPYAAKVNSKIIDQTELNAELRAWAGNRDYVTAFNSSNSSSGVTVAGDATGTYNTTWVANILGGMVGASIFRQQLASSGQVPSPAIDDASASVNAISQIGWDQFAAAFRQTLVVRLADESALSPPTVPVATLQSVYTHYLPNFFSELCTAESSAFNQAEAQALETNGVPNGTKTCYNQAQFSNQAAAFQTAVLNLPVGKTAPPIRTSYGYLVVRLISRTTQPFSNDVQRVLSTAILSAEGSPNSALDTLLAKAKVKINPAYGTWTSSQVVPPVPPSTGS